MKGISVNDLKMPAVYLETSFINRLADPLKRDARTRQEQIDSREWWRLYRSRYTLVISRATLDECSQYSNAPLVRLRSRFLARTTSPRLPTPELNKLVVALR
jgi:hypothetical protein